MSLIHKDLLKGELFEELKRLVPATRYVFVITMVTTFISLAPVVYMMEVYDRVVNSRSTETLLWLTFAVLFALLFVEILDHIKKRVMKNASLAIDMALHERVFKAIHWANIRKIPGVSHMQIRDLKTIQDFFASPAFIAILELPSALLFLILIFMINLQMGLFSLVGFAIQWLMTSINRNQVDKPLAEAQRISSETQFYATEMIKNAPVIKTMGMLSGVQARWLQKQQKMLSEQAIASDNAGRIMSLSKMVQMLQGSLILGLGVWLTINGHIPGGGAILIVASILGGKALSPLVQLLGMWKIIAGAITAYQRLTVFLNTVPKIKETIALPSPVGQLSVEQVVMAAPASNVAILRGVNFQLPAGQLLLILGPSGSGKSSLVKALMGVWPLNSGVVRLDGVDIAQWNKEELGPHIGYLPQEIDLFDGTIVENITRFGEVNQSALDEVIALFGLQELVEQLPDGIDTMIGDGGSILSGGQRQRIGLARAFYGWPKVLFLDEPNSSLDDEAERYLNQALALAKQKSCTTLVITHRSNLIQVADYLLVIEAGIVKRFGRRDEILAELQKAKEQAAPMQIKNSSVEGRS